MIKTAKCRWLLSVMGIVLVLLVACNLIIYIVDPFFQYRLKDGYIIDCSNYFIPGLIKSYDYDTIIIGSSMTQNFDMELFEAELECNPLHVGIGGMSDEDIVNYILLANKVGKAKTYYVCVDIPHFTSQSESRVIDYLMKDDLLSKIQYSISYESLFHYMPTDIGLELVTKAGHELPDSFKDRTSIDKLGYWGDKCVYGEETVIDGYKTGLNSVSEIDTRDLYDRMIEGIDIYLEQLDLSNADYIFFFPPYSSLFWCNAQESEYFDIYLDVKEYFVNKVYAFGGTVYDFQGAELTMDLRNYKDTTHYAPEINDVMTRCFALEENIITPDNCSESRNKIIDNTNSFRKKYEYLFD